MKIKINANQEPKGKTDKNNVKSIAFLTLFLNVLAIARSGDYQSDANGDGHPDFIIKRENGRPVVEKIDSNFDGKMDVVKEYKKNGYVEKRDLDHDGVFDRKIVAIPSGEDVVIQTFEVGKGKRKIKLKEETFSSLQRAKSAGDDGNCVLERENVLSYFENFAQTVREITHIARDDFVSPGKGLSVHKSCFRNFDEDDFNGLVVETVERGISCLGKLGEKNKNSRKRGEVFNLLDRFKAGFQDPERSVEIACGDKTLDWRGVAGYSSSREIEDYGEHGLDHPFVVMSPFYEDGFWGMNYRGSGIETEAFQGVLFHEMIHNFGYRHGSGLDTATGCEVCCFKGSKLKDLEGPACRLCAGNYESDLSGDYLKDLALMEAGSDTFSFLIAVSKRKSEIEWGDKELAALLEFYSGKNPALGKAIFGSVKDKFQDEQLASKWRARMEDTFGGGEKITDFNHSLAIFVKHFLVDGDEKKAFESLERIDSTTLRGTGMGGTLGMVRAKRTKEALSSFRMLLRLAAEHGADPSLRLKADRMLTFERGGR